MDVRLNISYEQVQGYKLQEVRVSKPMCNFFLCCHTYYQLSQYWALLILATMNKCTELRKYAFLVPCLLDFFFLLWWVLLTLKIFDTSLTLCVIKH